MYMCIHKYIYKYIYICKYIKIWEATCGGVGHTCSNLKLAAAPSCPNCSLS